MEKIKNESVSIGKEKPLKSLFKKVKKEFFSSSSKAKGLASVRESLIDSIKQLPEVNNCTVVLTVKKEEFVYAVDCMAIYSKVEDNMPYKKTLVSIDVPKEMASRYIIEELDSCGEYKAKFTMQDLDEIYNENDYTIFGVEFYDHLASSEDSIELLRFTDMVLYTRVEAIDSNGNVLWKRLYELVENLPEDIYKSLYPCGKADKILNRTNN